MTQPSLVWFRHDLRLEDHPALCAARNRGEPIIPVFIWSPDDEGDWTLGGASRWWLHHSLTKLDEQLTAAGSRLIIVEGSASKTLLSLAEKTNAKAVYWTHRYEPAFIELDKQIKADLRRHDLIAESFNGQLLFEPWEIETKEGRPYQVFTSFWKTCLAREQPPAPDSAIHHLPSPARWPSSLKIRELKLEPKIDWDEGIAKAWQPGTAAAKRELHRFLESTVLDYDKARDLPGQRGTSRLSPYLHFGEISARMVWHAVHEFFEHHRKGHLPQGAETFLKELVWREFSHHLLFHFPQTPNKPLHERFAKFPWRHDKKGLKAWQRGQTGYPIVDAGMRELWTTGWMHNRVRMIVASFLVKDLLLPWQEGAKWFWDTLVDADLANNTLGWQWTAGCGADAAPYFRVFNPALQSAKFDPEGTYIRQWVPELEKLPSKWIHTPSTAPVDVLAKAGVKLGADYPEPIVDHAEARVRALDALKETKFSNVERR